MTTNASASPIYRRKLIEVDLPLDEINAESAKDASLTHGHPSTLQKWWARRPLATCRAVIFASMVDDPSECPEEFPTEEEQRIERVRLHDIIKELVKWKNTDEKHPASRSLLNSARYEIARSLARSNGEAPPSYSDHAAVLQYLNDNSLPIYDPFAGGGSIPLEAQRLGLRAVASDLNPVAVLINKALIEIPHKFSGKPAINPNANPMGMFTGKYIGRGKNRKPEQVPWRGASGLASDIRYYGRWMREEAFKRIGHLYPKVKLPDGGEATVIVWMYARTVPCPNPACGVSMPLMGSFTLSKGEGSGQYLKPVIDRDRKSITFDIQNHTGGVPTRGTANRSGATCVSCNQAMKLDYIRQQSRDGNLGKQMTAVIAKNDDRRVYLSPSERHIEIEKSVKADWRPSTSLPSRQTKAISLQSYGMEEWHEVFTERQLLTLSTFTNLISEIRDVIIQDGADELYADAVCTYLSFAVSRVADSGNTFAVWESGGNFVAAAFSRQGLGMVWDFPEANPFSSSTQNWLAQINWVARVVDRLPSNVNLGKVYQANATTTIHIQNGPVIVTDPPYYDSIYYSDTSDFFYAWLRPMLRDIYPDLFASILTPKKEEMIANKYQFAEADKRFEKLMAKTLHLIRERCSPEFPASIFYAYKQQEEERDGRISTGWETMLTALVSAGFQIIGTWPMRTENTRALKSTRNQLASSIVMVCRPRAEDAPVAIRRQFLNELERELPDALDHLTREGHIAPVDLRQAAIGPGMQVYSRYANVQTPAGEPVSVRDALVAINNIVAKYFDEAEGEMDAPTRFCYQWLQQHGFASGPFGDAETLSQGLNTGMNTIAEQDGIITSARGLVQLVSIDEYGSSRSNPRSERPGTAWEGCFRMAYHMQQGDEYDGEEGAAKVLNDILDRRIPVDADAIERLARILYNHFDGKDTPHAVIFNRLVVSWQTIASKAQELREGSQGQLML